MSATSRQFVLIGVVEPQPDQVASEVVRSLAIEFEERDSEYRGEYYLRGDVDSDEEISVKRNQPNSSDELLEPDHSEFEVLIYIDGSTRADSIVHMLQHSELTVSVLREELI